MLAGETNMRTNMRTNAFNAVDQTTAPGPDNGVSDTQRSKLARVAKILGVDDPSDSKALRKALDAMITEEASPIAAACLRAVKGMPHLATPHHASDRDRLTERELEKCKAKGIDPAKYSAVKARTNRGGR
jgi:hypothetical protein